MTDGPQGGSQVPSPGGDPAPEPGRGQSSGPPATGPGSLTGFGRRLAALVIDWGSSLLVARLLLPDLSATSGSVIGYDGRFSLAVLGVFAVQRVLLTWLGGSSFGQRIVGSTVVRRDGGRAGLLQVVERTLLLCLVVPAVITGPDGRGLHDRLAGTMEISAR